MRTAALLATLALATATGAALADEIPAASSEPVPAGAYTVDKAHTSLIFRVNGELTLHGITKPLVLEARYNGGYAGHPFDPHARVGFSAQGTFKRSEFGVSYGIPAPGTRFGVSDEVAVTLESEFTGPPLRVAQR